MSDLSQLTRHEAVIDDGKEAFFRVGMALKAIRDHKLYRAKGHRNFDAYCKSRWEYTVGHATNLINGAKVRAMLPDPKKNDSPGIKAKPVKWTERAVRDLRSLGDVKARAVGSRALKEAESTGELLSKVVARHVREVKRQTAPPKPKPQRRMLEDEIREWTGKINGLAGILERVPVDALQIFARDHAGKARDLEKAIGRLEKSLAKVWERLP